METSPLRAAHEAAGARLAPAGAATPVLTFGDVPGEYAGAREGAALFDVSERGLVHLRGADAEGFLHRIVANTIRGVAPGAGNRNLLLTGKGKVVHDFDLARVAEDEYLLSTPPGDAARLIASLDMYLFTEDVALEDASAEHAPLELVGPRAREVLAARLGVEPPDEPHAHVVHELDGGAVRVTRLTVAGAPGWRIDGGPALAAELWRRLATDGAATPAGLVAWDSLRAEQVWAAWGRDITEEVYPQEARLEPAFSLDKGCYIGQEVVAKIDTYGGLNKRLMLLCVTHDDPVAAGTRLVRIDRGEPRDLGLVTSWAYSFELDGGVVLGYVKRKHQDAGTVFHLVPPGAEFEPALPTASIVR